MQYEFELNDWRKITPDTGWKTRTVEVWNGKETLHAHFAQDLSGEEQPPFSGWFYPVYGDKEQKRVSFYSAVHPTPTHWRPIA